jgi:hypothetical protein
MLVPDRARRVAEELGIRLHRFEPLVPNGAGKGRTCFAETATGEPVVVKWHAHGWERLPGAIGRSEELIRRGYPVARTLVHGPALGGYGLVQERLTGLPATLGPSPSVLDEVRAIVELQAARAGTRLSSPCWTAAAVRDDAMGWWRSAGQRSPAAADLCACLNAWLRAVPAPQRRTDFVFFDFNFTNILVTGDRLSGIVDIEFLSLGDRSLDLACLAFEYEILRYENRLLGHPDDPVERLMEDVLRISGRSGWRQAVAYLAIAHLGWVGPAGEQDPLDRCLWVIERLMNRAD